MSRSENLNSIAVSLSRFTSEVEIHNASSEYDINIHSEDILIPILNIIYDINLVNANRISKNFPAIDLVDTENKVGFQITSIDSSTKVNGTIEKFISNNLHERIDLLYIYILKSEKIKSKIRPDLLDHDFLIQDSVLNNSTLYEKIKGLNVDKIAKISSLLKKEFSESKITVRTTIKKVSEDDQEELVFPNLLPIEIPSLVRRYAISISEKEMLSSLGWKRKNRGDVTLRRLITQYIKKKNDIIFFSGDWIDFEGNILTFQELNEDSYLADVVDLASCESLEPIDEYDRNSWSIIHLLKLSLNSRLHDIDLEYAHEENVIRFKAQKSIREKKISWKLEAKSQPRTVIKEIMSKDKDNPHIVCFRHLAIKYSFYLIDKVFYMVILPTYSFTSDGKRKSRFSQFYMSGIKKLETNQVLYYHLRFWEHYLQKINQSVGNLIEDNDWPYPLNFKDLEGMKVRPAINDSLWNSKGNNSKKTISKTTNQISFFDEN